MEDKVVFKSRMFSSLADGAGMGTGTGTCSALGGTGGWKTYLEQKQWHQVGPSQSIFSLMRVDIVSLVIKDWKKGRTKAKQMKASDVHDHSVVSTKRGSAQTCKSFVITGSREKEKEGWVWNWTDLCVLCDGES